MPRIYHTKRHSTLIRRMKAHLAYYSTEQHITFVSTRASSYSTKKSKALFVELMSINVRISHGKKENCV